MQNPYRDPTYRNTQDGRDPLRTVRDFLYQVRDGHRTIMSIEKRICLRHEALKLNGDDDLARQLIGDEIYRLEKELEVKKSDYAATVLNVSDMISQLSDINQQMTLTYRYIDMISDWNEIADKMGMTKAAVQKLHGRTLPCLQEILVRLTQADVQ